MRAATPKLLTAIGVVLCAAAAGLSAFALFQLALVALAVAIAAIGVAASLESRATMRLLRTQRGAQQATYERLRLILHSLDRRDATAVAAVQSGSVEPAPDPRADDLARLVSGRTAGARVLLIGGARPTSVPGSVEVLDAAAPGTRSLPGAPHGYYTHVLLDAAALDQADQDDIRWLQRALRWQHDATIALASDGGVIGIDRVCEAVGATLGVEWQHGLITLRAPLGGGAQWGAA